MTDSDGAATFVFTFHNIGDVVDVYGTSPEDYRRILKVSKTEGALYGLSAFDIREVGKSREGASVEVDNNKTRRVVLTYDDAYESILDPILEGGRAPGLVFPIVDFIGQYNDWNRKASRRLRHLSWSQLSVLLENGIEIGSHTCAHWNLERLTDPEVEDEFRRSREILEDRLGVKVRAIAYPYGEASSRIRTIAARYYDFGFLTSMNGSEYPRAEKCELLGIMRQTVSSRTFGQMSDAAFTNRLCS